MFALLREVYSEECFAKRTIQHWHKSFHDGHQVTDGLPHAGWPHSSILEVNVNTVAVVFDEDCHLSVRQLEKVLHIPKTTIYRILKIEIQMRLVCSLWALHFLKDWWPTSAAFGCLQWKPLAHCWGSGFPTEKDRHGWKLGALPQPTHQTGEWTVEVPERSETAGSAAAEICRQGATGCLSQPPRGHLSTCLLPKMKINSGYYLKVCDFAYVFCSQTTRQLGHLDPAPG